MRRLSVEQFRDAVPALLRATDAWLGHREKKPLMLPECRRAARTNTPATWRPFGDALSFLERTREDPQVGVGFVLQRELGVVFVDFDHCLDDSGALNSWAVPLLEPFRGKTFIERSRSGHGLHVLVLGSVERAHPKLVPAGLHPSGDEGHLEVYNDRRYVALTGDLFDGAPSVLAPMQPEIDALVSAFGTKSTTPAPQQQGVPPSADVVEIRSALGAIDPDVGYKEWLEVGMALHDAFGGSEPGLALWDEWSAEGGKYKRGEPAERWASFGKEGKSGVTLGTVFYLATQHGWRGVTAAEDFAGCVMEGSEPQPLAEHPDEKLAGGNGGFLVLDDVNAEFFIIEEGGQHFVACERFDSVWQRRVLKRFTFSEFKNRFLGKGIRDRNGRVVPLAPAWLQWAGRREYLGGVTFDPTDSAPPDVLNLWRGWPIAPKPGDWSVIREHIRQIICAGNEAHFAYVMGWLRRLVQRPAEPGGVVLALRSREEGAGKGLFTEAVMRMFGQHAMSVHTPRMVVGQFNAHLRDLVVLVANEAVFAGDRAARGTLRALITERTFPIEQKGIDVVETRNFLHIIMTANDEWVVPVALDDRRFCVLDVSPARVKDYAYFAALAAAVGDDAVIAAMLHDLLAEPLGGFEVRDIPNTAARREQMVQSLEGAEAWLLDVLARGSLEFDGRGWADWQEWASTKMLAESHEAWARAGRYRHAVPAVVLGRTLSRFFRSCYPRPKDDGPRVRGYQLGTLAEARQRVCAVLGLPAGVFADEEPAP